MINNSNSNNNNLKNSGNAWFAPTLFLIFLVLKLLGKISWPWIWVCAPLWVPLCIAVILMVIMFMIGKD